MKSAERAAKEFLALPKSLTFETSFDPTDPVLLDMRELDRDPTRAFAALQPVVSVPPVAPKSLMPLSSLDVALSDDALPDADAVPWGLPF